MRINNLIRLRWFCLIIGGLFTNVSFSQTSKIETLVHELEGAQKAKAGDCDLAKILNKLSDEYGVAGDLNKSLNCGKLGLEKSLLCKNEETLADAYASLGLTYMDLGEYNKALEYLLNALKIREKGYGSKRALANALNNVALVNDYLEKYETALNFHKRALAIRTEINDTADIAQSLGNMGVILEGMGKRQEAIQCYRKAIDLYFLTGDSAAAAGALNNIGLVLVKDDKAESAIEYFVKAIALNKQSGDKIWLGNNYLCLGQACTKLKKYKEAEKYFELGLVAADEVGSPDIRSGIHLQQSYLFFSTGEFKRAFELRDLAALEKDSIYRESSARQTAEMQARFESEEKEEQIRLLEKDKKIQEEEAEKQRAALWFEGGILVLVIGFALFVSLTLRTTRRQKKEIEEKNRETEKQKKIIEEKQAEILSSIHYAKRIQQALMTNEKYIQKNLRRMNKRMSA